MKGTKITIVALFSFIAVPAAVVRAADTFTAVTVTDASPSRIYLKGDSTLHPYAATSTAVNFHAVVETTKPDSAVIDLSGARIRDVSLEVPVKELASGEKGLDKNMHKALKGEANPSIGFLANGPVTVERRGEVFHASVPGKLTIAGATKDATIEADLSSTEKGLRATGHYDLRMSDFGIKPPTIMGMIRVRDAVTVGFDLALTALRTAAPR